MPGQDSMRFYRGNQTGGGFDADLADVAAQFWASPLGRSHVTDPDNMWPLERSLRAFLTDPAGFNSTWVDEAGFWELHTKVRETWPEETIVVPPTADQEAHAADLKDRAARIQDGPR